LWDLSHKNKAKRKAVAFALTPKGVVPMVEIAIIIVLAIVAIVAVVSIYKLAKTIVTKK